MRKFLVVLLLLTLLLPASLTVHAQDQNIVETAQADGRFSTLVAALEAANLVETLQGDGPFTVFAPTDEAFAAALESMGVTQDDLFADTETLRDILLYHVVQGENLAADVSQLNSIRTMADADVSITAAEGVMLNNGVQVIEADIQASNGVIHVIDSVLLPPATTDSAAPAPEDLTYLRVAHLSPDAPAVEMYIDGEISEIQALEFGAITGWVELPAASYSIAVVPVGASLDEAVIGPVNYELEPGMWTTLAVIGSIENQTLTVQTLRLDYSPLEEGNARIAIFHAIEGAPAVDVMTDDATLAEGLSYAGTSTDFNIGLTTYDVPAGTYNVRVVPSGSPDSVLLDLSNTTFEAGTFYFIAAMGTPDNPDVLVEAVSVDRLNQESNADIMDDDGMGESEQEDMDSSG